MGRVLLYFSVARLAQLVERKALNLVVVGSSPTVGVYFQQNEVALCGVFWACGSDIRLRCSSICDPAEIDSLLVTF